MWCRTAWAISDALATSPEFAAQYGHLSDAQFVDLVYRNVLDRAPDGAGLAHWTALLARGTPRGEVMVGFSESTEFVAAAEELVEKVDHSGPVARLYRAYFLRVGETDGLRHWIGSELSYEAVSDAFATSQEFQDRYGSLSDSDFVDLVYANVLGRPPDAAGRQYWLAKLAGGTTRGSIMLGFSESDEFIVKTDTLP